MDLATLERMLQAATQAREHLAKRCSGRGKREDEEINTYREAFKLFDTDGSGITLAAWLQALTCVAAGSIEFNELQMLLGVVGIDSSQAAVHDLLQTMDTDASGGLEVCEFIQLMKRYKQTGVQEQQMEALWKELDPEDTGSTTPGALRRLMDRAGCSITQWELRRMVHQADTNKDGSIGYEEFKRSFGDSTWARTRELGSKLHQLKTVWQLLDSNGNGEVDLEEIIQLFGMLGIQMDPEKAALILEEADMDADGSVSYAEFLIAYSNHKSWSHLKTFGALSERVTVLQREREEHYGEWAARERVAGFGETNSGLLERGLLYRHPEVRVAIGKLWQATSKYRDEAGLSMEMAPNEQCVVCSEGPATVELYEEDAGSMAL